MAERESMQPDMQSGLEDVLVACRLAQCAAASATLTVVRGLLASNEAEDTGRRVSDLVAMTLRIPLPAATTMISIARRTGLMPVLADALAEALLTLDHLKVINGALSPRVDVIDEELQTEFVSLARHMTFTRWAQLVRRTIDLLDEDGGHRPERPDTLHLDRGLDGTLLLSGNYSAGADGEIVESVLREEADRIFHQWRADRKLDPDLPKPSRSELLARALANLARRAAAQPIESTTPAKPLVVVTMEARNAGALTALDGRRLSRQAAEEILADCRMVPLIVDTDGAPLWMGRSVRFGTAAQELATGQRDGGCVHPGCTVPLQWTHMHHARWWTRDGGPTDVDNLPRLCGHHHRVVHREGWSIEPSTRHDGAHDGWWVFTRPDGTRYWSQRHGRQRSGSPPPPSMDSGQAA